VTQRNLYGPAVDQILATETVAPVSMGEQAAGLVNWLLPNNQGTIRDVAQYSGGATTVVDHLVYDSFGTITYQSNSTYQPIVTYAGMQLDTVTGLDYDNARWYDATTSVFISQDPIGFGDGGTNLAMYCGNSPTNATDPTGMQAEPDLPEPDVPIDPDDDGGEPSGTYNWIDEYLYNPAFRRNVEIENEQRWNSEHGIVDPPPEIGDPDVDNGETNGQGSNGGFGAEDTWQTNREPGDPFASGNGQWVRPTGNNDIYTPPPFIPAEEYTPSPESQQAIAQAELEEQADAAREALANARNPASGPANDPLQMLHDITGVKPTQTPEQVLRNLLTPVGTIGSGSSSGGESSRPVTAPYGDLADELTGTGEQANHLNQNAVYKSIIPESEGLANGMRGNAFTERGSPHYKFHRSLEEFWNQYRSDGPLAGTRPTNAQYGHALQQALEAGGYSPADAADIAARAAAQRSAYGLSESAPVPRIPGPIYQAP
jgi:RHS repeat-associated protein